MRNTMAHRCSIFKHVNFVLIQDYTPVEEIAEAEPTEDAEDGGDESAEPVYTGPGPAPLPPANYCSAPVKLDIPDQAARTDNQEFPPTSQVLAPPQIGAAPVQYTLPPTSLPQNLPHPFSLPPNGMPLGQSVAAPGPPTVPPFPVGALAQQIMDHQKKQQASSAAPAPLPVALAARFVSPQASRPAEDSVVTATGTISSSHTPSYDPKRPSRFDKPPANYDPSKIPPTYDPTAAPVDPSRMPPGYDPSKLPPGFDPSKMPPGFDPSKMPPGFDPTKMPPGFDPMKMPPFDPSKMPPFDPSKMPPFDPTKMPPGLDPSKMPPFPMPPGMRPGSFPPGQRPPFDPSRFPVPIPGRPPFDPALMPGGIPPMFRPPPMPYSSSSDRDRRSRDRDYERDRDRDRDRDRKSYDHHDKDGSRRSNQDSYHRSSSYDRSYEERRSSPYKHDRQSSPYDPNRKSVPPTLHNGHIPPHHITQAQWNKETKPEGKSC